MRFCLQAAPSEAVPHVAAVITVDEQAMGTQGQRGVAAIWKVCDPATGARPVPPPQKSLLCRTASGHVLRVATEDRLTAGVFPPPPAGNHLSPPLRAEVTMSRRFCQRQAAQADATFRQCHRPIPLQNHLPVPVHLPQMPQHLSQHPESAVAKRGDEVAERWFKQVVKKNHFLLSNNEMSLQFAWHDPVIFLVKNSLVRTLWDRCQVVLLVHMMKSVCATSVLD